MIENSIRIEFGQVPPSDNAIREVKKITVGKRYGKRLLKDVIGYTKEAENYKKELMAHIDREYFVDVQRFRRGHRPWSVYEVVITIFLPESKLLNKSWLDRWASDSKPGTKNPHKKGQRKAKSPYKVLDAFNRRKLVEDALAEALDVDDSYSWNGHIFKRIGEEKIVVELYEIDPVEDVGIPEKYCCE